MNINDRTELGKLADRLRTYARHNTQMDKDMLAAAQAIQFDLDIQRTTDYLTEQRAAMRDAAAQLVDQARHVAKNADIAAAIRALDPRPVLTQGSIDRAKHALADANLEGARPRLGQLVPAKMMGGQLVATEDFAGAVWNGPNTASQVHPNMALPHRTPAQHLEHAASSAAGRAMLMNAADVVLSPTEAAAQLPLAKAREGDLTHKTHTVTVNENRPHKGYIRAMCSCGWASDERDPREPRAYAETRDDIARHTREVDLARRGN